MSNKTTKAYRFFPADKDSIAILHQRAEACARHVEEEKTDDIGIPYIKFRLSQNELYGIEFKSTKGVIQAANIKKPPCVPSVICGVINYHGMLLGVIDLEQLLNLKPTSKDKDPAMKHNIIIVSSSPMTVGMAVGEIEMSDSYKPDGLNESLLSEIDIQNAFLKGIDKGKVSIINVEKVLASLKITEGGVS